VRRAIKVALPLPWRVGLKRSDLRIGAFHDYPKDIKSDPTRYWLSVSSAELFGTEQLCEFERHHF
jgi:hypothetical protein